MKRVFALQSWRCAGYCSRLHCTLNNYHCSLPPPPARPLVAADPVAMKEFVVTVPILLSSFLPCTVEQQTFSSKPLSYLLQPTQ